MEAVVTSIRRKHKVTEQQMTQVMVAYQADAEVQTAVTTLREVRPPPPTAPAAVPAELRAHVRAHALSDWCGARRADRTSGSRVRQAMSGKAPAKQAASPASAKAKPVRRAKPRQRKG